MSNSPLNSADYEIEHDDEEYLTRVVVDVCKRMFYLYSNEGTYREVECETTDQFMDVLELVRGVVDDDIVHYSASIVAEQN